MAPILPSAQTQESNRDRWQSYWSPDRIEKIRQHLEEEARRLVETVASYLDRGYRRIKIKIKPGREVDETTAIRSTYPDLRLQVDANSAYTLETADVLKAIDDLDLLLIEQPLFEDDIWDHRKLQAGFKTPICLDESIISPRHARYALEMEACRIINIKPARVGGLSQGIAIHDYCLERGVPVWCGGMLETGVGRASNLALASLPGFILPGDIGTRAVDRTENDYTRLVSLSAPEREPAHAMADPGRSSSVGST